MIQITIEQFNIDFADNSTFNTQHSTLPKASINVQLTVINVHKNNS